MSTHPKKFERHITDECSLCGGHFGDGTPYVKTELEAWDGRYAVLCGKCIDAMHAEIHAGEEVNKPKPDRRRKA